MKHSRVISIDAEKQFDKIKHLFLGWEIPWRRTRLPTPVFLGFPGVSAGKESTCSPGDLGLIPGLERSLEKGTATTPVFWLGESHGLYRPWGRKESDTTE